MSGAPILERNGRERRILAAGQAAGVQVVGPIRISVYEFRRKNRISCVLQGESLAADVGTVQLEAKLYHEPGDDPIWYPLDTAAIPAAAVVALIFDALVVGPAVRLSITFARVSVSDVVVELAQS